MQNVIVINVLNTNVAVEIVVEVALIKDKKPIGLAATRKM